VLLLLTSCSIKKCDLHPATIEQIGWVNSTFDGGQIIVDCKVETDEYKSDSN